MERITRSYRAVPILVACLLLAPSLSAAGTQIGAVGSLGVPRGFLDVTVNGAIHLRTDIASFLEGELAVSNSFGTKSDERGGGRLSMFVNSGYALGRLNLPRIKSTVQPYLAAGGGIHWLHSIASESSIVNEKNSEWTLKGHGLFGLDLPLRENLYLTTWGRTTFPSDRIFDSIYFGVGWNLL